VADRRLFGRAGPPALGLGEAFRLLFEAAPDGLALLDQAGRIIAANPALGRLARPALPMRPGLPAVRLLAPAARPLLAERLAADPPAATPLLAAPADPAAPEDAEWALTLERLPAMAGAALLLRVADRTAQRRADRQLAEGARLETVGRLAGGIGHDFNNLLAVILGSAGAMRTIGLAPPAAAELGHLADAAARGAGLVRQLLAFTRQQRLQPRVLGLNDAIGALAPLVKRLVGERIRVELGLEQPGRLVRIDPTQLDQIVLNLAANAREAMPGGGTLRIATGHAVVLRPEGEGPGAVPPGRYAVLEVSDTGCGIAPDALPRLFEPFFTTRPEQGGTGLGLATVQGIVAQSGGRIGVVSRLGEGSTFRIHLPRQDGAADPVLIAGRTGAAVPIASTKPVQAGPPGLARILLVEDEAPLRRLAALVLRRAGHEVIEADCAEAALDLLAEADAPDILVSDVAMPGMDGLELARQLRGRWPGLPVLLLSGYAASTLGADLEAAAIGFLGKPYAPAYLLASLVGMLSQARPFAA